MKALILLGFAALLSPTNAITAENEQSRALAPSAQISEPPSPAKLILIRRFLKVIGIQGRLDSGNFLERYAIPGGPLWQVRTDQAPTEDLKDGFERRMKALNAAYAPLRTEYQEAYESHVNWEFTEAELAEIVSFLESPVGKHFLDGRWRMEAYVETDTEEMDEQIVKDAMANLAN